MEQMVPKETRRQGTCMSWKQVDAAFEQCCLHAGGDLYEDLKQTGGRFEEARTAAGVMRPCISALIYLHSQASTLLQLKLYE